MAARPLIEISIRQRQLPAHLDGHALERNRLARRKDFPSPGETVMLTWQQNSQNFVLTAME